MKKTILIQLVALFAFSTFATAQIRPSQRNFSPLSIVNYFPAQSNLPNSCATNFAFRQPTNGAISTIEVVRQGYRNNDEECVFDVNLFVTPSIEQYVDESSIEWQINGNPVSGNQRQISVPVSGYNYVSVSYIIGSQRVVASRTF